MIQIAPLSSKILEALAEYKYLTVSHIKKLGISTSIESIRRELRYLKGRKFVGRMTSSSVPESLQHRLNARKIRNEDLNYLTPKGAKILDEEMHYSISDIRFPKRGKITLSNDYFHRVSSVSFHIAYNQWIEANDYEHLETLLYYDKRAKFKGLNVNSETRIKRQDKSTKTPDLIFGFNNAQDQGRVFILELYNGNRPQYILEQTIELFETIQETTEFSDRVGIQKMPRVLITCEDSNKLGIAINKIKQNNYFNFDRIGKILFFNTDQKAWDNFGKEWINLHGEIVNLEDL